MVNSFFNKFNSIISIKVSGKNVYNFIDRIIKSKINIYDVFIISKKEAIIKVLNSDYLKLKKTNYIYEIVPYKYYGILKFKKYMKDNYIFYIAILLGIGLLFFLTNVIFRIEVIHSNLEIRNLIDKELKYNGIRKFSFKKDYDELEKIEDKILEDNKDKLEWLEINVRGTKYVVKVMERKLDNDILDNTIYDVVSCKNAIISKVMASSGVILKNTNDYVKKDEVIVSSLVALPDGSFKVASAKGKVLGEVWYEVEVAHPYIYKEEIVTGKRKDVFVFKFLNKRFSLFDFSKYDTFKYREKVILSSDFNMIRLVKEKQYELKVIDEYYTKEQLINKIIGIARDKISAGLNDEEYIKSYSILNEEATEEGISLKIFFSVVEEVGCLKVANNLEEM